MDNRKIALVMERHRVGDRPPGLLDFESSGAGSHLENPRRDASGTLIFRRLRALQAEAPNLLRRLGGSKIFDTFEFPDPGRFRKDECGCRTRAAPRQQRHADNKSESVHQSTNCSELRYNFEVARFKPARTKAKAAANVPNAGLPCLVLVILVILATMALMYYALKSSGS